MASVSTIYVKLGVEMRAEATRKAMQEKVAETHPSKPKTSHKWVGRTKGLPFSRTLLVDSIPAVTGAPALLTLAHPTRGRVHTKPATPDLLRVFFPAIPENLAAAMLGH